MNLPDNLANNLEDKNTSGNLGINGLLSSGVPYDQWIPLQSTSVRPSARYKHAAEVADGKLYAMGGSRNGRYLSDIQVFDFETLTWSVFKLNRDSSKDTEAINSLEEAIPACSGHNLVYWKSKLLIVAGNSKEKSERVTVWSIDLGTHNYSTVNTHGKVPSARGGQSVTLVGSKLIMFGGEDRSRHVLNDLHILDLETMTWEEAETTQNSPAARFDHTAAVHADRYLMVFGGSSHATCFSDLHVLDLQTMEWSEPQTQGDIVTPRAGHAGIAVAETWYIVGGGDNKSGSCETVKLNMSKLVWSVVTNVKERDPLASEGLTVSMTTVDGESFLVAFGGYNGKYHNEVFVLKCKPSHPKQPRIFQSPAAAAAAASVTAAYAVASLTESNKSDMSKREGKNIDQMPTQKPHLHVAVTVDAVVEEKQNLEAKLADVRAENLRLKGNLDELSNLHTDLSMELQSVQGQLQAEISRCSKLELQISEMRKRLESLPSVELELDALRQHKSSWQAEVADTQVQRSQGLWQWMAGNS